MTMINEQPNQEYNVIEVEPGSKSDPFSVNYDPASGPSTSPVELPVRGAERVVAADGPQVQPVAPATNTAPLAATPQAAAPTADPSTPEPVVPVVPDVEALLKERLETALRAQQSAADKRMAALEKQLNEAKEATIRAQRDAKLNSEDLSDDEKAILRDKFLLEDERAQLAKDVEENDKYYRELMIERYARDYAQFGVTAVELDAIDEPDDMEAFVLKKELEFLRSGKAPATAVVPAAVVTAPVTAAVEPTAPAGASAPTHIGGNAPAPQAPAFRREASADAMRENLKNLSWETIKLPS